MHIFKVTFRARVCQPKTQGEPTVGADKFGCINVAGFDKIAAGSAQDAETIFKTTFRRRHEVRTLRAHAVQQLA